MLTKKQNFLETIKADGNPDRLVCDYEFVASDMVDPVQRYTRGNRVKGKTTKDRWGTTYIWPENQLFAFPSESDLVCPDVTKWKDTVKVPDLVANCSDPALWKDAIDFKNSVNSDEQMVMSFMGTGIFEQAHNLRTITGICLDTVLEPESLQELLEAIGEYRFQYTKLLVDNLHPDVIISHDDWGSKYSLFIGPEAWREFIKPHYRRMYDYMKSNGVIILHHADSFCEPIVPDMIDLGIDVWQGVLNTNDIVKLQKEYGKDITFMGGIDSVIDRPDSTEAEIRAEVRKVCETYGPGKHFIPGITYGLKGTLYPHVEPIICDEIHKYNMEVYGVCSSN